MEISALVNPDYDTCALSFHGKRTYGIRIGGFISNTSLTPHKILPLDERGTCYTDHDGVMYGTHAPFVCKNILGSLIIQRRDSLIGVKTYELGGVNTTSTFDSFFGVMKDGDIDEFWALEHEYAINKYKVFYRVGGKTFIMGEFVVMNAHYVAGALNIEKSDRVRNLNFTFEVDLPTFEL
jgi:hypothetical protein